MFDISLNNIIKMVRGDSGSFNVILNNGTTIEPNIIELTTEYDSIYVGVMEAEEKFEHAIIRKKYGINDLNEDGSLTVTFKPEDTEYLLPGVYYYEVKVELVTPIVGENEVEVYTVIPRTKFIIME